MESNGEPKVLSVVRNRILFAGMVAAHSRCARFDPRDRRNRRLFSEKRKASENRGGKFIEKFAIEKRIVESNAECFGCGDLKCSGIGAISGKFGWSAARADARIIAAGKKRAARRGAKAAEFRRNGLFLRRGDEKIYGLFAARKRRRSLFPARRTAADSAAGKINRQPLIGKYQIFRA